LLPLLLALCAGWLVVPAQAEKADRQKPMNIEADALRYDDLKQTSVFTGNVVVTKGTMVMRGSRIDVRQDPEGYQYATVLAAPNKPAYYKQKREGVDETIEAEAETVEYDGKADTLRFVKTAVLRRFKGAALNDETQGSLITYDNTTDIFTVESRPGPATAGSSNPGGRVRAMLTPRDAQGASPLGAPVTPPATLRSSPQMGGPATPAPGDKK
jgi:lipopolysaccharide export system protein LptA